MKGAVQAFKLVQVTLHVLMSSLVYLLSYIHPCFSVLVLRSDLQRYYDRALSRLSYDVYFCRRLCTSSILAVTDRYLCSQLSL